MLRSRPNCCCIRLTPNAIMPMHITGILVNKLTWKLFSCKSCLIFPINGGMDEIPNRRFNATINTTKIIFYFSWCTPFKFIWCILKHHIIYRRAHQFVVLYLCHLIQKSKKETHEWISLSSKKSLQPVFLLTDPNISADFFCIQHRLKIDIVLQ